MICFGGRGTFATQKQITSLAGSDIGMSEVDQFTVEPGDAHKELDFSSGVRWAGVRLK
jgi:hypothetical protein